MSDSTQLKPEEMCEKLDSLMRKIEEWRIKQVSCICRSHQITAFHLATLTEEKFRVYGMGNFFSNLSELEAHVQMRNDIFALEWALRGLMLPEHTFMLIEKLRNSWTQTIADRALKALKSLADYHHVRDLVICAKRGGYTVETPAEKVFYFRDNPNWQGMGDIKSRLIAQMVSKDRNIVTNNTTPETFSLGSTSSYEDFPHDVQSSSYSSSNFWFLWEHIWQISRDALIESAKIHNYGTYAATSKTKDLCIIITKKKLTDGIVQAKGVSRETISIFLRWLMFNSQTPRKFSLFHCPLVKINEKFVLIAPHVFLMGHAPTIFLRQLAHHDKEVYDACSSSLEKQLLKRLKNHIEGDNRIIQIGVKLHTPKGQMELDVVEYDKSHSTLSIAQAKLTIRPDTVSEVDHTNDVLAEGIEQLRRNKMFFCEGQANLVELFIKLGINIDDSLTVKYFLMPTRFTGSDFLDIPSWIATLPIEFCLRPQCRGLPLCSIWEDYKKLWDSLDNTVESSHTEREFEIAGFRIIYPGFHV